MKKVLFATSALVASAGFAAADVSLSGSAEMGIVGGTGVNTQFHQDIDVTFTLSGTTDNGLTFGAAVDLDEAAVDACTSTSTSTSVTTIAPGADATADNDNTATTTTTTTTTTACTENAMGATGAHGGVAVFISGNFGTLTMGDTDGGFDWGMGEVPTGSGSINDAESGHLGFSGNAGLDGTYDGQILRYDHSIGGLGFAVSIELDDTNTAGNDDVIGLGLRYSVGGMNLGFGYQSTTVANVGREIFGLSVGTTVADIALALNYSSQSRDNWVSDQNHMGIGASYSMDAITIGVNYGQLSNVGGATGVDQSGWGLSAGYDLGGGASIVMGYGNSSPNAGADTNSWSLGVSMGF